MVALYIGHQAYGKSSMFAQAELVNHTTALAGLKTLQTHSWGSVTESVIL